MAQLRDFYGSRWRALSQAILVFGAAGSVAARKSSISAGNIDASPQKLGYGRRDHPAHSLEGVATDDGTCDQTSETSFTAQNPVPYLRAVCLYAPGPMSNTSSPVQVPVFGLQGRPSVHLFSPA